MNLAELLTLHLQDPEADSFSLALSSTLCRTINHSVGEQLTSILCMAVILLVAAAAAILQLEMFHPLLMIKMMIKSLHHTYDDDFDVNNLQDANTGSAINKS